MSRSFWTATVLLILAGCTSKKDLGSLPDGGSGSGGTGGVAGTGSGGSGGSTGAAGATGGGTGGSAGTVGGGSGGSTGVAGASASGGAAGSAGAGSGGSGGSTGVAGTGGGAGGSSGGAGRGGTTGNAGAGGVAGIGGGAGTGGVAGAGAGGGAGGAVGSCIGAPNQTGRGPALITIPGGTFTFGAANLSPANPPRSVPVDTFRIDRTLVTAAQFRECVQAGCCTLIPPPEACATNYSATGGARDNYPMNCVSLAEATAFCAWAGKEIPTEEQWEYAARGPGATPRSFPWGNLPPLWADGKLVDPSPVCSYYETTNPPTSQAGCSVGAHPQGDTPEGVQDMAGNVRQWTTNCDNVNCVVKSDDVSSQFWYSAYRSTTGIQSHLLWLGFRCVRPGPSGTGGSTGTGGTGGAETHTITEFPLPTASQPGQITAGADGNVWFTESGDNKIGRITPAGTITEFPLAAANSRSRGIAAGADGNVWFTGSGGFSVGVITPAGTITEFTPDYVSSANYLAKGPVTESSILYTDGFYVGRITTSGTPGIFGGRQSITNGLGPLVAGSELGTMWVAGGSGLDGRIYRLYAPGGSSTWTVTEFMVAGSLGINGITLGPDRNVWFTTTTDRIGRITSSGTLTRFPLPNPNAAPYGIATGPDGNLWFTENTGNKIGRITPTGTVTEFTVPTPNAGLRGITAGADGNLWFIEYTANKIGRITP